MIKITSTIAIIVCIAALAAAAPMTNDDFIEVRGASDWFGLKPFITELTENGKNQWTALLAKITLSGKAAIEAAKPIIAKLISDLKNHIGNSKDLFATAFATLQALQAIKPLDGRRDIAESRISAAEFFLDTLGFGALWSGMQSAGTTAFTTFKQYLSDIKALGISAWIQAIPVFKQLLGDLKDHASNSSPYIQSALDKLKEIIGASVGRRDLAIQNARGIFDSLGLGSILSTIVSSATDNWTQLVSSLLFAGNSVLSQVKPVIAQLVTDVKDHASNAVPLLHAAFENLQAILMNSLPKPKNSRALWSLPQLETIFGAAGNVISTVSSLAADLQGKFQAALQSVWDAGVSAWGPATTVLKELASDLKGHANLARPLISAAIEKLKGIAATHAGNAINSIGRRDLYANWSILSVLENFFGLNLGPVLSQVSTFGSDLLAQMQSVLATIASEGWNAINKARVVIVQLIQDIKDHAGNAKPLFIEALAQLSQIAIAGANNAAGGLGRRAVFGNFDLLSVLENFFGLNLGPVLSQVSTFGSDLLAQMQEVLKTIASEGWNAINKAREVIVQLVKDIKDHAGNAKPLFIEALAQLSQIAIAGVNQG